MITPKRLPPGDDWVLFALTPEGLRSLNGNLAEGMRWTKEALDQLRYYRGEGPLAEVQK